MIDMLTRAADILRSEGWEQEAAVVSKAADEIERLRAALHEWDALIEHQYSGSREAMSDMTYAARHTAHLLHGEEPWPEPRLTRGGDQ